MPEEEPIDLDKLRDDVLAGRDTGHSGPDFSKMADEQRREWPPHIIQPDLHPEVDWSADPDINKLRLIALEREAHATGKTMEEVAREKGINLDSLT
jgi:hypothetical protein